MPVTRKSSQRRSESAPASLNASGIHRSREFAQSTAWWSDPFSRYRFLRLQVPFLPRDFAIFGPFDPAERAGIIGVVVFDVTVDRRNTLVGRSDNRVLELLPQEPGKGAFPAGAGMSGMIRLRGSAQQFMPSLRAISRLLRYGLKVDTKLPRRLRVGGDYFSNFIGPPLYGINRECQLTGYTEPAFSAQF